jgi:hypothetical protein
MTRRYKKRAPLKAQAVFDYRELHKLDTIASVARATGVSYSYAHKLLRPTVSPSTWGEETNDAETARIMEEQASESAHTLSLTPPLKVSTYLGERRSFIPLEDEKFSRHLVPVLILIVGAIGALAVWYS